MTGTGKSRYFLVDIRNKLFYELDPFLYIHVLHNEAILQQVINAETIYWILSNDHTITDLPTLDEISAFLGLPPSVNNHL